MSSKFVRDEIKSFLTANAPTENLIDLTAQYLELDEVISDAGLTRNDPWLGIQFVDSFEEPQSVTSNNTTGKYRETGSFFLHFVERASSTVVDDILTRSETLRSLLRGRRINGIIIEGVTPANFETGATLQMDGGYQAASIIISYERDLDL